MKGREATAFACKYHLFCLHANGAVDLLKRPISVTPNLAETALNHDFTAELRQSENAALCLSRGLPSSRSWDELAKTAQRALAACNAFSLTDLKAQYGENGEALHLAARILDDYATHALCFDSDVARQRNLQAACAFGAVGNGPSAHVAITRAFPTLRPRTRGHAALLLACAPSLAPQIRAHLERIPGGAESADALQQFLQSGDEALIPPARDAWLALFENAASAETTLFHPARMSLEHAFVLGTARALRAHSSIAPDEFARLVESRPVLLPPQWKALRSGLLSRGENAVVSLQPSTGKTLLGELCVLAGFESEHDDGVAVFLAPYVALGRQTAQALQEHLPASMRVHSWLGGHEASGADLQRGRHVAVATPERLDALLRARPELVARLRIVVCDEAHLVSDGNRGARLEGLLTRLRLMQREGSPRLVLLSAAAGEAHELGDWMQSPEALRIRDAWTPTARRLAIWTPDGSLAWHDAASGERLGAARVPWPHPLRATESWPQLQKLEPLAHANVAHLASFLHEKHGGAVLCVCATRAGARDLALSMSRSWPNGAEPKGARAQAIALIDERFAWLQPLKTCLQKGVAWHNGTLPHELRALIEDAVRAHELGAVASTTTLAEGVDLPFRWTLLCDWLHWTSATEAKGEAEKRALRPMSRALWRNVSGRCGRAGVYTEGDTLAFDNPLGPLEFTGPDVRAGWHEALFLSREPETPRSALESLSPDVAEAWAAQLLAAIAESSLLAATPKAATPPDIAPFHVASRLVNASYAAHLGDVSELQNLTRELCDAFARDGFAERVNGELRLTPLGRAANLTGFSPCSCRVIVNALRDLRAPRSLFDDAFDDAQNPRDKGDQPATRAAREIAALLLSARHAPASPSQMTRLCAGRSRLPLCPDDLPRVLEGWLQGLAPEELFARLPRAAKAALQAAHDQAQAETDDHADASGHAVAHVAVETAPPGFDAFADWLRATVETWAPWLCRAASVLEPFARDSTAPAWPWESWAKWCEIGADSQWAIEASRRRVPGGRRALALLGRFWPQAWCGDFDVLGLSQMRNAGLEEFEIVVRAALKAAGGRYSPDGRGVLQARDWLWEQK